MPRGILTLVLVVLCGCGGHSATPPRGHSSSGGDGGQGGFSGAGGAGGSAGAGGAGGNRCEPPPSGACVRSICGSQTCQAETSLLTGSGIQGAAAAPVPGREDLFVVAPGTSPSGDPGTFLVRVAPDGQVAATVDVTATAGTTTPSLARAGSQVLLAGNGPDGPLLGLVRGNNTVVAPEGWMPPDPLVAQTFQAMTPTPDGQEVVLAANRDGPGTALIWLSPTGASETGWVSVPETFNSYALTTTTAGAVLVGSLHDPDLGVEAIDLRSVHRGSLKGSSRLRLMEAPHLQTFGAVAALAIDGGFFVALQHLPSGEIEVLGLDPSAHINSRLVLDPPSETSSRILKLFRSTCSVWLLAEGPGGLMAFHFDASPDLSKTPPLASPAGPGSTAVPWLSETEGTLRLVRSTNSGVLLDEARGCGIE